MLTYFLQVNLCWLIFYGLYYVLLSKETFFKLNRIYLIISLLCGLALPFFTERLSQMQEVSTMPIVEIAQPIAQSISIFQENIEMQMPSTEPSWNLWLILRGLYMVGIFYFLTQFVVALWRIFKLYKNGVKEKNKGFTLVNTEGVKTPFLFFKWIFINSKIAQTVDFQHIIMHEKAHVQQKHSFDIVGIEILRGLFWLSPMVHLYARSLRHVHEYLADAAVLQNTEKKQYGRLLINQTAAGSGLVLANHLNFSQLKKRIIMMTRNRSQRVALVKYTLAAPLFIVLIILFASPKNGLMAKTEVLSEKISNTVDKIERKIENSTQANKNIKPKPIIIKVDTVNKPQNNGFFDPRVRLAGKLEGIISEKTFHKLKFLDLVQPLYNPPMECNILSFQLIRVPFGSGLKQEVKNTGQQFNDETLKLIQQAGNGDTYSFVNIRGKYQVDVAARILSNAVFTIGENMEDLLGVYPSKITTDYKDKIPEPFPTLNGLRGSSIEIKKFKELNEMIPYEKNEFGYFKAIPKDLGEIESFTIRIKDEGEAIFCQGNQFNDAAKLLISNAKQGNTYHFDNIIFKMNSGAMLKWNLGEMYFSMKKVPVVEWSTGAEWFVKPLPPINIFREVPADAELLTCTINHYTNGELKPGEHVQFTGFTWSEEASQLFQKAQIGDVYEFANIKARRRGHTKIDDFASIRYKLN